jgi:hypothetical protein
VLHSLRRPKIIGPVVHRADRLPTGNSPNHVSPQSTPYNMSISDRSAMLGRFLSKKRV